MPLSPHQQRLRDIIKKLKAASTETRRSALEVIGAQMLARVKMGFYRGVDPYGEPWVPLAHRNGQPLRDTGRLQNSFGVLFIGEHHVTVGSNVEYGLYQQDGFKTRLGRGKRLKLSLGLTSKTLGMPWVPPRPMLPDSRGFPERWRQGVREALVKWLRDHVTT